MKKFKAFLSILLVLITVISVPTSTYALGKKSAEKQAVAEAETEAPKRGTDRVATMYLCVSNANPAKPHVWVYIINETNETFTVGHYNLGPHKTMSMGAFKDRGDGNGIYYNLERYWVKDATYERTYCMSTAVSRNEMQRMSNAVNRHNYWLWLLNCNWFGTCMWNCCSPKFILYLFFPQVTRVEMLLWGAKRPDIKFEKQYDEDSVFKHTKDGKKVVKYSVLPTNTGV